MFALVVMAHTRSLDRHHRPTRPVHHIRLRKRLRGSVHRRLVDKTADIVRDCVGARPPHHLQWMAIRVAAQRVGVDNHNDFGALKIADMLHRIREDCRLGVGEFESVRREVNLGSCGIELE